MSMKRAAVYIQNVDRIELYSPRPTQGGVLQNTMQTLVVPARGKFEVKPVLALLDDSHHHADDRCRKLRGIGAYEYHA